MPETTLNTAPEVKKIWATKASKPTCAAGFGSNQKNSTVPGRSRHLGNDALEFQNKGSNADSGAQLKVRTFSSGLNK
jgi:hypothetical protein